VFKKSTRAVSRTAWFYYSQCLIVIGHYIVKMFDRVTSSCPQVGGKMVNCKWAKFQSHITMDFDNI
jgi:hypothetical protein